jgi:hypothetical protein
MISVNEIAVQISRDLALKEAAIRDKGIELANLESQITRAQDEVDVVKAQCKADILTAQKDRQIAQQAALSVNDELRMAKSALAACRETCTSEINAHKVALHEMTAQYRAVEKAERDNIARLASVRDTIKAEIHALIEKLKDLK